MLSLTFMYLALMVFFIRTQTTQHILYTPVQKEADLGHIETMHKFAFGFDNVKNVFFRYVLPNIYEKGHVHALIHSIKILTQQTTAE